VKPSLILTCLLLTALSAAAQTAPPASTAPTVQVTSSVDRTAVWVADRVTYAVDIVCSPGAEVLLDDVAKEKLRLNGLEIVSTDATTTTDATGRTLHHLRYVLTTYHIDIPTLTIEPMSIRYYARRSGQRLQDVAPAGEAKVPGATVAFRSTLPDQPQVHVRDQRTPAPRQPLYAHANQIGLAALILALAPGVILLAGAVRQRTAPSTRPSKRRIKQDQQAALERLKTLDVATEEDRRRAYDEISTAVREHVAARAQVPASALTAPEIEAALAGNGKVSRETVTALLAACDTARYGPSQSVPPAQACRDALSEAEQLLSAR
jgi:hypothetical protein